MSIKQLMISTLNKIPYVRGMHKEISLLKKNARYPPGHFYSTIISVDEVREREDEIWKNEMHDGIKGLNLNTIDQISLVSNFEKFYAELPFTDQNTGSNRYYYKNPFYSYTDAIVLHAMMRHFRPNRIIEIGSGFSSAVMLDTNEIFFDNSIELTFIEPYPGRLNKLLKDNDKASTIIHEKKVQDIDLEQFDILEEGDFLFIDSSHVIKTGSDVHYILFEILPRLRRGVFIHFHDIFYPFEYPRDWVYMGRNWNEDYFLKAFLMYNNQFDIVLFSDYLHKHHKEVFQDMPLCYENTGGNLWIMKN